MLMNFVKQELTIAGSLTAVVLDVIRYQLLNEGINLGLLSSAFSLVGLNLLWSPDFLSMFRAKYSLKSKIWLFCILILCCSLAAIVGPASALLFIPIRVWKVCASTEFYLGGKEEQLWPNHLTTNHSGPEICHQIPPVLEMVCPYGGYDSLTNQLKNLPNPGWQIILNDKGDMRRVMSGHTYYCNVHADSQGVSEVWAYTSRGDTTQMMIDLGFKFDIAQSLATGRNRRLRNFDSGRYDITEGKLPVGRTVCGPPIVVERDTAAVPFPVLASDHAWHNMSIGLEQTWGQVEEFEVTGLQRFDGVGQSTQAHAQWLVLGPEFGAATAGVAVVSQNETTAVARGCTLDYRWALGQTFINVNTLLNAIDSSIGRPESPIAGKLLRFDRQDFFDRDLVPWYEETIKVDQEWLDTMSSWSVATSETAGYTISGFEALLDATLVADPTNTMVLGPGARMRVTIDA